MSANAFVRARIDGKLRDEATEVLAAMGLTVSDFVRIGLTSVVRDRALPFEMRLPNKLTAETLEKSDRGEDLHHRDSAEAMFEDLGI